MAKGSRIITPYGFTEVVVKIEQGIDGIHIYTDKSILSGTWYHAEKCILIL